MSRKKIIIILFIPVFIFSSVVITGKALGSPYNIWNTFMWFVRVMSPTLTEYVEVNKQPLSQNLQQENASINIVFFGDLMYMPGDKIPTPCKEIQTLFNKADVVIGNCEAPVTHKNKNPEAKYLFNFKFPEDYINDFIEKYQIHPSSLILNLANNHIGDQGVDGLKESVNRLERMGITTTGHSFNENYMGSIIVSGLNVGVIGFTQWINREVFDGNEILRMKDLDKLNFEKIKNELDILIATPHWDYEFCHMPREYTVETAHKLLTGSVDIIAGHHPHVVQPIEIVNNKPCFYSLGNFIGDVPTWPAWLIFVAEVEMSYEGELVSYKVHPFVQITGDNSAKLIPVDEVDDNELKNKILDRIKFIEGKSI